MSSLDDKLVNDTTRDKIFSKPFSKKKSQNLIQKTLMLNEDVVKKLDKESRKINKSLSEIVRDILEIALDEFYEDADKSE